MKRLFYKKDGYVLTWLVCLFLIVAVIATIAVSSAVMSTQSVLNEHKTQQVYYTAKSAAASVADYIVKNANNPEVMQKIIAGSGQGSNTDMGDYSVEVSYVSTAKIKVRATATYLGETTSATVYIVQPPAPSGIIPTDNVIYINGTADTGIGQCKLTGSVYVDGNLNLSQGSSISGFAVVKGNTTITGAGATTKGLFSFGNVLLDNSGTVSGDLSTKGDLKLLGSGQITGIATADGSLTIGNSGYIAGYAEIGKNASFSGGSNRMGGTLTYGGTLTPSTGITTFVPKGATKSSTLKPVDDSKYGAQALPVVKTPTIQDMPELYNTITLSNNTISSSGTINSSVISQMKQLDWGSTISINAIGKDINLLLNNTNLSIDKGFKIEINTDGAHNVYLYMTGSSSITIHSNEYYGMKVRSSNPRLFIFGDGTQSIGIYNNSELNACVYIPNGTLTASGSPLKTYKFVGTCIVKKVNIDSDVAFFYSKPYLDNTPLAVFSSGGSSSGNPAWIVESWGTN